MNIHAHASQIPLIFCTLIFCLPNPIAESDDGSRLMVYNRWGRVGVKGQDKLHGPYTSPECAIQEFEQKFYAKTKNQWSDRKEFVCHQKSYTWLEMDYTETQKELDVSFHFSLMLMLSCIVALCSRYLHFEHIES